MKCLRDALTQWAFPIRVVSPLATAKAFVVPTNLCANSSALGEPDGTAA